MNCLSALLSLLLITLPAAAKASAPTPFDPWPAITPLIMGAYAGSCAERPGPPGAPGAITIGADGEARGAGIALDPRDSALIEFWRGRVGGKVQSKVVLLTGYEESYFILLRKTTAIARPSRLASGRSHVAR